jgi:hypothetical protein
MEFLKIILFCILAAICYGIVHDQITARVCVEYFTIGHPPVFHTESPTLLGLGWGVIATWWVGLFLGVPLALVARLGRRPKLTAKQIAPSIFKLLCVMAVCALVSGITGYVLVSRGSVEMPEYIVQAIPAAHRVRFMADWWAHSASYLVGFVGGIVVIVMSGLRRRRPGEVDSFH